jgi:D-alanyl-D-alanine carboxypeptidase/D-alanyl-D-alanine-endopeptidase (penicillin-binding protein 4)
VGGGDPTLATGPKGTYPGAARLDALAKQVAAKGKVTKLSYDSSLFTGPALAPGWDSDVVSGGAGSPVSALAVDGGRKKPAADPESQTPGSRAADPAKDAAVKFGKLLGLGASQVVPGTATAGAQPIASLQSPPVQWLVDQMLGFSDNVIAEALLRQVAIAKKQPATFTGGAAARHQVLQELGVDVTGEQLQDGSGLSRLDKLTPQLLTEVLKAAVSREHAGLHGIVSGLPVAGYSGTLATRFGSAAAAPGIGEVRAKTGTLSGVDALAGVVMTKDGTQLAFALVANGTAGSARPVMDKLAAKLAACGCP